MVGIITKNSLKRLFDVLLSSCGLVVLFPVMAFTALAIRFTSPGPVFYSSPRVGLGGKSFSMIKFRTMVTGAEKMGSLVTVRDDHRITRIGCYLRRTKLDELPTLFNVLKGNMSLVGPRPENPKSAARYTEEQKCIWTVRPGITSLATIKYRHEESILAGTADLEATYFQVMQDKLALELEYVERQSFWFDLRIIFQTLLVISR